MNVKNALLVLACSALAACASTDSTTSDTSSGSSGSTARTASSSVDSATEGAMQTNVAQNWSATVTSIEPISRQDAGIGVGGSVAAAAAGGSTSTTSDRVYRVTVRGDDGSSRSVNVEMMPDYKVGDRVMYSNGMLTRQ